MQNAGPGGPGEQVAGMDENDRLGKAPDQKRLDARETTRKATLHVHASTIPSCGVE